MWFFLSWALRFTSLVGLQTIINFTPSVLKLDNFMFVISQTILELLVYKKNNIEIYNTK